MPSGAHLSPWEPLDISFLGEAIRPGMVPWAAEPPKSPGTLFTCLPAPPPPVSSCKVVKEMVCELETHF